VQGFSERTKENGEKVPSEKPVLWPILQRKVLNELHSEKYNNYLIFVLSMTFVIFRGLFPATCVQNTSVVVHPLSCDMIFYASFQGEWAPWLWGCTVYNWLIRKVCMFTLTPTVSCNMASTVSYPVFIFI